MQSQVRNARLAGLAAVVMLAGTIVPAVAFTACEVTDTGGVDDKSSGSKGAQNTLILRGVILMGGVEIKNPFEKLGIKQNGLVLSVSNSVALEKDPIDVELRWAPDRIAHGDAVSASPLDDRPSIFTAVQEQLGLKLEAVHEPVPNLVVDHITKPSEN